MPATRRNVAALPGETLGAAWRGVAIWELYREHGGRLERRLLGYPGGDWRTFDGTLPMDVTRVENEVEVNE